KPVVGAPLTVVKRVILRLLIHVFDDLARQADAAIGAVEALRRLLADPNHAWKGWVWEQYDHLIFLGTIQAPGGDAAVIRLPDSDVAVAVTTDGHGRYCYLDPYEGARLAVAEAARNLACTGARPLAVTNCLNFGNPEKTDVMWQFAEAVRGIGDACLDLGTPVTGGNVSFYNETSGRPIYPTPVIGMLGVLPSPDANMPMAFRSEGDVIVLLGRTDPGDMGGSEFAKVINGVVAGRPPSLDMEAEKALIELLGSLNASRSIVSAHDPSLGGVAVGLVESALAGGLGFTLTVELDHSHLFSESPSRALVSCDPLNLTALLAEAEMAGVAAEVIGTVGGTDLSFEGFKVPMETAKRIYEGSLSATLSANTIAS
ncbi:MAG: AIR synthase related protein, partial [Actinomycetota bacterium]